MTLYIKGREASAFDRWIGRFLLSSVVILAVTALGKLLSILGEEAILSRPNPLFSFLTNRQVMLIAAILEVVVVYCAVFSDQLDRGLWGVGWLGTVFFAYRAGLWGVGYSAPCSCLGGFTEAIGLPQDMPNVIMEVVLGYLLVGSYGLWFMKKVGAYRAKAWYG